MESELHLPYCLHNQLASFCLQFLVPLLVTAHLNGRRGTWGQSSCNILEGEGAAQSLVHERPPPQNGGCLKNLKVWGSGHLYPIVMDGYRG